MKNNSTEVRSFFGSLIPAGLGIIMGFISVILAPNNGHALSATLNVNGNFHFIFYAVCSSFSKGVFSHLITESELRKGSYLFQDEKTLVLVPHDGNGQGPVTLICIDGFKPSFEKTLD